MALRNLKLGERNRIISEFYLAPLNEDKLFTVWHFVNNYGLAKKTVFRAFQRADKIWWGQRKMLDRRPGSGRLRAARQELSILRALENQKRLSTEPQARKYNITQPTIQ